MCVSCLVLCAVWVCMRRPVPFAVPHPADLTVCVCVRVLVVIVHSVSASVSGLEFVTLCMLFAEWLVATGRAQRFAIPLTVLVLLAVAEQLCYLWIVFYWD